MGLCIHPPASLLQEPQVGGPFWYGFYGLCTRLHVQLAVCLWQVAHSVQDLTR